MSTRLNHHAGQTDCGLLLVGHGSREPDGVEELLATARLVAQGAAGRPTEPCFLEFAQPTIAEGFATLARRGVRHVVVVPALLFSAGHVRRDIPAAVAAIAADYPGVSVEQTEHLGCHQALVELSKLRYLEALARQPSMPGGETALVMVGRGSHDARATAEMLRFVELRRSSAPAAHIYAGFIAMADPRIEHVLEQVARGGARRVVVQPHLLFGGVLMDRIADIVARFAQRHPQVQWLTTGHLGPSELVARAILERANPQP